MSNLINIRNKKAANLRWKKIYEKEWKYIKKNNIYYLKARVFGYIAGDGNISARKSISGTHYLIRFFPDHKSLIRPFSDAFIRVYNKKPIIKPKKNFYALKIYSKPIVQDILSYGHFGTYDWDLPKKILVNKRCKREWLRAFFDAEAYVGPKHIKLHSVNEKGLNKIKDILFDDFKINSKIYKYQPKNPNHKTQFLLMIISKKERQKYLERIGFNHEIKTDKLLNYLN